MYIVYIHYGTKETGFKLRFLPYNSRIHACDNRLFRT